MKLKKGDIFITLGLIALSILMAFSLSKINSKSSGAMLRIEKDSKLLYELPLDEDREVVLDDGDTYNKVIIKDGKAYMQEADCADQVCVHMHPIKLSGETIICLPNKVFLEVVGDKSTDLEIDKVNR